MFCAWQAHFGVADGEETEGPFVLRGPSCPTGTYTQSLWVGEPQPAVQ